MIAFGIRVFLFLVVCLNGLNASSQKVTLPHTSIQLFSSVSGVKKDQDLLLAVVLEPLPHWHTYWKNPGDSGLPPTFSWSIDGTPLKPIEEIFPTPKLLSSGPLMSYGYEGPTVFFFKLKMPPSLGKEIVLTLNANWLVCKEECIPEEAELTLTLPSTTEGADVQSLHEDIFSKHFSRDYPSDKILKGDFEEQGDWLTISLSKEALEKFSKIKEAYFFPLQKNWIKHAQPQKIEHGGERFLLKIPLSQTKEKTQTEGLLKLTLQDGAFIAYPLFLTKKNAGGALNSVSSKEDLSFLWMIGFAFLGGIILNIMPCVFPVLSLKVLSFLRQKHPLFHAISYTLGVLFSFGVLAGIVILLKHGGTHLGWGFQMQSPVFVGVLTYIMFLVALNLSGFFEVSWMPGSQAQSEDMRGLQGSFLTGMLATLVATPCTAPFMATAIGYAFSQESLVIFSVFLSVGAGLAFPLFLLSALPGIQRVLPKPGMWMIHAKEFLAFPLYATVLWLLWVLIQQTGAFGFLCVGAGLWGLGISLWAYQTYKHRLKMFSRNALILLGILVILSPLWILSKAEETPISSTSTSSVLPYSPQALEDLQKQDKPVFVYATAAWCLTCKLNEIFLKSDEVQRYFKDQAITVMEADWTQNHPDVTLFLERFGRRGVPLYVYFPPRSRREEPVILPQILSKTLIFNTLNTKGKK